MTAVEALAAGTPVAGTRVGTLPDLLNGPFGRVVDPGDTHGLARALEELLAMQRDAGSAGGHDESGSGATAQVRQTSLRQQAMARADEYSWERVVDEVIETYAEVQYGR